MLALNSGQSEGIDDNMGSFGMNGICPFAAGYGSEFNLTQSDVNYNKSIAFISREFNGFNEDTEGINTTKYQYSGADAFINTDKNKLNDANNYILFEIDMEHKCYTVYGPTLNGNDAFVGSSQTHVYHRCGTMYHFVDNWKGDYIDQLCITRLGGGRKNSNIQNFDMLFGNLEVYAR